MSSPSRLTERDLETLIELAGFADAFARTPQYYPRGWARPMDIGAHNGSHHSYTLSRLVALGLAERRYRNGATNVRYARGSYEYRITEAGKALIPR